MTNFYILSYKYDLSETNAGVLTFTNKALAIETARYYRDRLHCAFVSLRHDKQNRCGMCDIIGFIDLIDF